MDKVGEEFVLSTPVTGIDSTLNYESGKLTVNLEGIFSRAGAMMASTNRVETTKSSNFSTAWSINVGP